MALKQTYKKFYTGGFVEFSYSPKWLSMLNEYDKRPLALFINYDTQKKYLQMINFHFLQVSQRKILIKLIKKKSGIEDFHEFGEPLEFLTYNWLKKVYPTCLIAYRRYFTNRIRNVSIKAWQWDPKEIDKDVIHTPTAKIVGVTPEQIQRLAIKAMKARAGTKVKHARARGKARRKTSIRR